MLVLIVVAVLGGITWWLYASRQQSEEAAKNFARDVATRLAFDFDRKLLDRVIAPEQMAKYPPSYRERVVEKLRTFGRPTSPVEVTGQVLFTSHFFNPVGTFRAQLNYPGMPAALHLAISRPRGWWQIDDLNVSWDQPPPPEPPPEPPPVDPAAVATPTPTPKPTPTPRPTPAPTPRPTAAPTPTPTPTPIR